MRSPARRAAEGRAAPGAGRSSAPGAALSARRAASPLLPWSWPRSSGRCAGFAGPARWA